MASRLLCDTCRRSNIPRWSCRRCRNHPCLRIGISHTRRSIFPYLALHSSVLSIGRSVISQNPSDSLYGSKHKSKCSQSPQCSFLFIFYLLSSVHIRPFSHQARSSRGNSAYYLSPTTRYLWLPFLRVQYRDSTFRFRLLTTFRNGRR